MRCPVSHSTGTEGKPKGKARLQGKEEPMRAVQAKLWEAFTWLKFLLGLVWV